MLGEKRPLVEVIGQRRRLRYHGALADVICLPHPSGASTWHRAEPGKSLLAKAMKQLARHPELQRWR